MKSMGMALVLAGAALAFQAAPASAQTVNMTANLTGDQEVPIILTGAFGDATVTVDMAKQTITYKVNVYNLPSGLTLSHIHVGPKGISGPIIFDFKPIPNLSNDFSISGTAGIADLIVRPDQGIRSMEDALQAVAAGNAYVNVHSTVNGSGEIRGQLVVVK